MLDQLLMLGDWFSPSVLVRQGSGMPHARGVNCGWCGLRGGLVGHRWYQEVLGDGSLTQSESIT
jgi:hypothetical protein